MQDAFVVRLNPTLTAILQATYLGGGLQGHRLRHRRPSDERRDPRRRVHLFDRLSRNGRRHSADRRRVVRRRLRGTLGSDADVAPSGDLLQPGGLHILCRDPPEQRRSPRRWCRRRSPARRRRFGQPPGSGRGRSARVERRQRRLRRAPDSRSRRHRDAAGARRRSSGLRDLSDRRVPTGMVSSSRARPSTWSLPGRTQARPPCPRPERPRSRVRRSPPTRSRTPRPPTARSQREQPASCVASADCYQVSVSDAPGRPTHLDAFLTETLSTKDYLFWKLHVGDSFTDVPRSHLFYRRIETLLHSGITSGCTATTYCPERPGVSLPDGDLHRQGQGGRRARGPRFRQAERISVQLSRRPERSVALCRRRPGRHLLQARPLPGSAERDAGLRDLPLLSPSQR